MTPTTTSIASSEIEMADVSAMSLFSLVMLFTSSASLEEERLELLVCMARWWVQMCFRRVREAERKVAKDTRTEADCVM